MPLDARRDFYRETLELLNGSQIPYLVGGAFAMAAYAGVRRDTKDLDVFVLPEDAPRVVEVFARAGFDARLIATHWLAKVTREDYVLDIVFGSRNGLCRVDDLWFRHAQAGSVGPIAVRFIPVEEMIWSKAFVMERHRYDGADIAHLLQARSRAVDWRRLVTRFGPHAAVLLSHVLLFLYIYPGKAVPAWLLPELLELARQSEAPVDSLCRGTLLSQEQYRADVESWGYRDARLKPLGNLSPEQLEE